MLVAIPIAGVVALFNGLTSAFLAARFPVAGGSYEYGYVPLSVWVIGAVLIALGLIWKSQRRD